MARFFHLTHWGRLTHISISKLSNIGSNNGLAPGRHQAIIWTNDAILLIGPSGTNFSEIHRNSNIFIQENAFEIVVCHLVSLKTKAWFLCFTMSGLGFFSAAYSVFVFRSVFMSCCNRRWHTFLTFSHQKCWWHKGLWKWHWRLSGNKLLSNATMAWLTDIYRYMSLSFDELTLSKSMQIK